jgi:hypothetical protein
MTRSKGKTESAKVYIKGPRCTYLTPPRAMPSTDPSASPGDAANSKITPNEPPPPDDVVSKSMFVNELLERGGARDERMT